MYHETLYFSFAIVDSVLLLYISYLEFLIVLEPCLFFINFIIDQICLWLFVCVCFFSWGFPTASQGILQVRIYLKTMNIRKVFLKIIISCIFWDKKSQISNQIINYCAPKCVQSLNLFLLLICDSCLKPVLKWRFLFSQIIRGETIEIFC